MTSRSQTLSSSEGRLNVAARRSPAVEAFLVRLLRWAPKRAFSSIVGVYARKRLPRFARKAVYSAFARRVGVNLDEVEKPLEDYPSLDDFFVRSLKAGVRPISDDPDAVVSPCDGTIAEHGRAVAGRMIQAKGIDYKLANLVPDAEAALRFEGGAYVTIYLAPRDYHRVHFPIDGTLDGFQHVPGALFPVNALSARNVGGLFTINERLITFLESPAGAMAVVMVAATGVGHMTVSFDGVETHHPKRGRPGARVRYRSRRPVERGADLGAFHLGSTVILLFEPGRVALVPLTVGQRIRMGEPIAQRILAREPDGRAA